MKPKTIKELEELRNELIKYWSDVEGNKFDHAITCDRCRGKEYCDWVYDPYNINGDCVEEK